MKIFGIGTDIININIAFNVATSPCMDENYTPVILLSLVLPNTKQSQEFCVK